MSSKDKLEYKQMSHIKRKELVDALHGILADKYTDEEILRKIRDLGLDLEGEYRLSNDLLDGASSIVSSITMESSTEEYDAEWVEALKQLAEGLDDEEALQLIVAAKESMLAATSMPRDVNNNIVNTASSGNISSAMDPGELKENLKEEEIINMMDELKIEDTPVPVELPPDGSAKAVEDESKNV